MGALNPRTYVPPDDETAIQLVLQIEARQLRPHCDDGQPHECTVEMRREIDESREIDEIVRRDQMRKRRHQRSPWIWDFIHGIRPAWNRVEELIWDEHNLRLTRDELDHRIHDDAIELVDTYLVDFVHADRMRRLAHVVELTTTASQQSLDDAIDGIQQWSGLWKHEHDAVDRAIELVRKWRELGDVQLGRFSGSSAASVFEAVVDDVFGCWNEHPNDFAEFLRSLPSMTELESELQKEYRTTQACLMMRIPTGKALPVPVEPPRQKPNDSISPCVPIGVAEIAVSESAPTVLHSPDFASVNWFGTLYEFTTNQAACIKVLWEAWQAGTPTLSQREILEAAGVSSERLDKVFEEKKQGKLIKNPAWTDMIDSPKRGKYRLKPHTAKSPANSPT